MSKKEGPFSRFAKAIREIRKQPPSPEAIEKFNRIVEKGERPPRKDEQKPRRKIARSPEADL